MSLYDFIKNRWEMFSWTGPKKAPYGDLLRPLTLPSVDYSSDKEKSITTAIDCYVTGSYITNRGKVFTIRERYSITVTYSNSTILETMSRIRQLLISKFQEENPNFNIDNIFIPELLPELKMVPKPRYMYRGGKVYRYLTKIEEGKMMLGTEKDLYRSNAERIIKKYGLRRSEGLVTSSHTLKGGASNG